MVKITQAELESWAVVALRVLQDFCDAAQAAAGDPDGERELPDVRVLMLEGERILKRVAEKRNL